MASSPRTQESSSTTAARRCLGEPLRRQCCAATEKNHAPRWHSLKHGSYLAGPITRRGGPMHPTIAAAAAMVLAGSASAQSSRYYLLSGSAGSSGAQVVQGSAIVQSWSTYDYAL